MDGRRTYTIRVSTGKRVGVDWLSSPFSCVPGSSQEKELGIEYPSSWFKNCKSKPQVEFKLRSTTLNELRGIVKSGIMKTNLNIDTANYYLYLVLKEVKEKLNEDWASYGVQIGSKNAEICPWDLLNISVVDGLTTDADEIVAATSQDDHWMVIYILSVYRCLTITNRDHRKSVISRIVHQLKLTNKKLIFSAMEDPSTYFTWKQDSNYHKMIAAIDMFFTRFPSNSWAHDIKIGTIGSRFKGCGALLAIEHIKSMLGLSLAEFKGWIWTDNTGADIERMMRDDEETDKEFSYFPYQLDLGLVQKTAYSTSVNESVFFLVHAACTLLGSERSKNAKHHFETNVHSTIMNAQIIAYAFSKKLHPKKTVPQEDLKGKESMIPLNTNASAWYNFMKKLNFQPFEDMIAFTTEAKNKIGAVQSGTIGEYLKRNL